MASRSGPLADFKIIDCTMALAGPFGTGLLADLGADVIKVEPPGGDVSRSVAPLPPDYANAGASTPAGVDFGGYFASVNRNKRSIVLDLKEQTGRECLLDLCAHADAIVENMRVGVMDRLGVGYEVIRERNTKIVYGALRGFGDPRTGKSPYAEWPAFDIVAQSMSGLAGITGPTDDGGYPCGVSVGDIYPGTMLALGLVAAVHRARINGEGQFFDVAMYDAMLAFNETLIANYGYSGKQLPPRGRHHPNLAPFGVFPTKDGHVAIAALSPHHWKTLCIAMQREDLIEDARTRNAFVRCRNLDFVEPVVAGWTSIHRNQSIMDMIGGEVPCGPVNTAEDIFNDPHVEAREMIRRFSLPGDNPDVAIVGSPLKFERTPTKDFARAPLLDEHGDEILKELGIKRP